MLSQIISGIELFAYGIIIAGVVLVILSLLLSSRSNENANEGVKRESKGIVFLGPIPLVWGYSRKTQGALFVILLVVFLSWYLLIS
ncbi:MAG: DUF131 domain-containing protein [Candidatus Thorarchaeota archaeon]|nr:DUF131 domain-containing protein [Candidatus Thorarchaeota archaeon]MCK5239044.1 DUF131 domain-containing protein [Candidatus Thorarchaeota archaeon]